ncbi:hypothetical protein L0F63_003353 [Massospora cicadina]|nr:hypothetical protein L0F63_003353 [Massospora cicadina]
MENKRYTTRSSTRKLSYRELGSSPRNPQLAASERSKVKSRLQPLPKVYETRSKKILTVIKELTIESTSSDGAYVDDDSEEDAGSIKEAVAKGKLTQINEITNHCGMCKREEFESCYNCGIALCLFCDERLQDMSQYDPPAKKTTNPTRWSCFNCHHFEGDLDAILTYKKLREDERVYLVTWNGHSYHDATWTHLAWLKHKSPAKVKNFHERVDQLEEPPLPKDVIDEEWLVPEVVLDALFVNPKAKQALTLKGIGEVLVKWRGVPFDRSSWEPFVPKLKFYDQLIPLVEKYVRSLSIPPPQKVSAENLKFVELKKQPAFITGGTLYPYQLNGLNWLYYQWCNRNPAILADEMGLGKTIQIICFLNLIYLKAKAYPFLIVVPKAVVANWFREFSVWAPELIVAVYTGGAEERSLIRGSGLFNKDGTVRAHVLITTYTTLANEPSVGQRLKNADGYCYKKMSSVAACHRVLLTGTPLQNNLGELFSLMAFMDPKRFDSGDEFLEKYKDLSQESVAELHELLTPYFLRRTKANIEVAVPVSMTPLQRELYKAALSRDFDLLKSIAPGKAIANVPLKRKNLANMVMELRKVLNHPYLIPGVEPTDDDAPPEEVHRRLIESCGKLRLVHRLLKSLKANGHRVLIFSQFKLVLDVLEDYLVGEGLKFLRIDGDTASEKRQSMVDQFNQEGSDAFVFLLTTRAGGVGMNLASADTVILYDLDFNPHSDLQALSRAHRIGQQRDVLVLRMISRNTVEERMLEIAKRKMVLDHLIVQRLGEAALDADDIRSIIRFGAKALFEEDGSAKEITYTDQEVEALLDRTAHANQPAPVAEAEPFGFSRLWTAADPAVEDLEATDEFWSNLLKARLAERAPTEQLGRGARKRVSRTLPNVTWSSSDEDAKPPKRNKSRSGSARDDEYIYVSSSGGPSPISQPERPSPPRVPHNLPFSREPTDVPTLPQPTVDALPPPRMYGFGPLLSSIINSTLPAPPRALPCCKPTRSPSDPTPSLNHLPNFRGHPRLIGPLTGRRILVFVGCPMYVFNLNVQVLKHKISGQPELLGEYRYAMVANWILAQSKLPPYTGAAPSSAQIQSPFPEVVPQHKGNPNVSFVRLYARILPHLPAYVLVVGLSVAAVGASLPSPVSFWVRVVPTLKPSL